MTSWLLNNKEWLFSGLGVFFLSLIAAAIKWIAPASGNQGHNTNLVGPLPSKTKADFSILFIDDETSFKVVNILQEAGWSSTRIVRDVSSLDGGPVASADLIFVDIQGVGVELGFREGGLGLTKAIKQKHPVKFVVIYSAESRGNRFHEALQIADASLSKTSDPYQFQMIVEKFFDRWREI